MSKNQPQPRRIVDCAGLAEYLKVSKKTVYKMFRRFPHFRLGKLIRFDLNKIDVALEEFEEPGTDYLEKGRKDIDEIW